MPVKRPSVANSAADPLVQFVKLTIDGEDYQLAYDFNAIAEAQKLADCNLLHGILALLARYPDAAELRALLFTALRKAHPRITIEQAGNLIRHDTMGDIVQALRDAYDNSLPEGKKLRPTGGGENPPPA